MPNAEAGVNLTHIHPFAAVFLFADIADGITGRRPTMFKIGFAIRRLRRTDIGFADHRATVPVTGIVITRTLPNLYRITHNAVQFLSITTACAMSNRVDQLRHVLFIAGRTQLQEIQTAFNGVRQLAVFDGKITLQRRRTLAGALPRRQAQSRLASQTDITGQQIVCLSRQSRHQCNGHSRRR